METRFEFLDFIKVFGLSIILFALFAGLIQYLPGTTELVNSFHPSVSFLLTYAIQFVVLFFPLWLLVISKYGASLSEFGFKKVSWKNWFLTIVLTYIGYIVLTIGISALLEALNLTVPGYQMQESYIPFFGDDPFGFFVAFVVIVLFAPFLEEFLFRGFIYQVLTKTWPTWLGSIMTAVLFSLIHFQLSSIISILILGLLLNYVYQRTGSVWTSIGFHALNNSVAFSVDIYLYYHPEILEELELVTGFLY